MKIQTIRGYGFTGSEDPLKLALTEKELRPLKKGETLIKNSAAGLNPVDYKLLAGFSADQHDHIMGVDGVGIAVESGDPEISIGGRYAYHTDLRFDGSFADYTIVPSRALFPLPSSVSDVIAAALPCPGLTALQCLKKIRPTASQPVLVYGAGGAVGRILSSLLIDEGAQVFCVCSKRHHEELISRGAVCCIEYSELDTLPERLRFYAVFDLARAGAALFPLLGYYGHYVSVLGRIEENPLPAFGICPSLHEVALGAIHRHGTRRDFDSLKRDAARLFTEAAQLLLPPIETVPFSSLPQALSRLKSESTGRKFIALMLSD